MEILDGQPRTVTIRHDENNQIISRREAGSATGKLRSIHYRFNGVELGEISNNGTQNVTYDASVHERETPAGSGPFALGSTVGRSQSDFNQHYDAINSYGQSSGGGGSYTVRAGDTLASIAQAVWGDAQLWYKIAEINALGVDGALQKKLVIDMPKGSKVHPDLQALAKDYRKNIEIART